MAPAQTNAAIAIDMFKRMADVYDGPIILQNAAAYAPLSGEQIARLIDDVPQIKYVKEERPPGPRHIAEVYGLVGTKVKTIFGGAAGKFLPDELRRGADGCMPACEIADLLARVMERWWAREEAGARELHRRLLPLIIRETHPFMRYILKRRGVFTSTVERAPAGPDALDDDDKREISTLIEGIAGDVEYYPFGPE
jgi:4-hydroxy-tetrahydrodipicolinate synthase